MKIVRPVLSEIIVAIGERNFPSYLAHCLCDFARFDLATVMVHRPGKDSQILFDNLEKDARRGLEAYARATHRLNPMLTETGNRVVRARDYRPSFADLPAILRSQIQLEPEEELGFRTIGWPERQEEIGLYFSGWGGVVEIGLYRDRSRRAAPAGLLRALTNLVDPIRVAFERHRLLGPPCPQISTSVLTPREQEICDLMFKGCSSETIALRLSLSRYTVKDHRKSIFRKLAITSLAELFALSR